MNNSNRKYVKLPLPDPLEPAKTRFGKAHVKGMERLGKAVIPDAADMPAFRDIRAEQYLNRMLDFMYEDDRSAILVILKLFSVMPVFLIRGVVSLIETGSTWKGMAGAPFRMLQIGLKGLIFTMYYSDMTPGHVIHSRIGYDARIIM